MPRHWELVATIFDVNRIDIVKLYRRVDGSSMMVPHDQLDINDRLRDFDKRNPLWG